MNKLLIALILLFSAGGIVLSHLLINDHLTVYSGAVTSSLFCGGGGRVDCTQVALHPAAYLFARPLPVWGLVYFIFMLGLGVSAACYRGTDRKAVVALGTILCLLAFLFDLYLGVIMALQIRVICPNCVATYGVNLALLVLFTLLDRRTREPVRWSRLLPSWEALRRGSLADYYRNLVKAGWLATVVIVMAVVFLMSSTSFSRIEALSQAQLEGYLTKLLMRPPEIDMAAFDGQPALGPDDAPIRAVVIGDFQCDFCRSLANNLELLRREWPDKIRVIHVDSPISSTCNPKVPTPFHEDACWLAEAGVCAAEQGRFWEYHRLVSREIPFPVVSRDKVMERLAEIDLDTERFAACMASDRPREAVGKDLELCERLGFTVTPTVVINGQARSGAMFPSMLRQVLWVLIQYFEYEELRLQAADDSSHAGADSDSLTKRVRSLSPRPSPPP